MVERALQAGDRVSWETSQGRTTGKVVRKLTRRTKVHDFEVHATKDDPRWLVESEKSGERAAHKAEALRRLS